MNTPDSFRPSTEAWFSLQAQPKHEHVASTHLRQHFQLETFLPRIRYKRPTRCGPVWITEALFPGYLFARFNLELSLRKVRHARGVRDVIHFGNRWPAIPDHTIAELQREMGFEELQVIENSFGEGDAVEIAGGAFHGLHAVVSRVMSGGARVAVLLDFLGRQTTVELEPQLLVPAN